MAPVASLLVLTVELEDVVVDDEAGDDATVDDVVVDQVVADEVVVEEVMVEEPVVSELKDFVLFRVGMRRVLVELLFGVAVEHM